MKSITRIVLTGGPAAGKSTLVSRVLKEFKQEDGWRVIIVPESATDLISGYDAVLHLVSCAKGAEYAYNFGNAARYESVERAREMDDRTLAAWSAHPNLHIIDNSVDFEEKISRGITAIFSLVGQSAPAETKRKYLIAMPDLALLQDKHKALPIDMMQTYLSSPHPDITRRVRQHRTGSDYLYLYTEKRRGEDGKTWVTERPISQKEYVSYLMEADLTMHPVRKTKYRFPYADKRMEIDVYPFSQDKAVLFVYGTGEDAPSVPPELQILRDVSGLPDYKNRALAQSQRL